MRAFIGRIEEVNNQITALVDERFDLAIEEARKVDKLIQSGEYDETELQDKFPLLGVPFTIKDSFCVAGSSHKLKFRGARCVCDNFVHDFVQD